MTPERYAQIGELYQAALEREPTRRAAFLAAASAGDEILRSEVESLLAAHEQAASFIEQPAPEMAAQVFVEEQMPPPLQVGQQLGAYQLQELLGRGGMGEVYLALDTRLQRKVAIKLLPARFTTDADRVRRFAQEARAASALNHPNILTIHEIGEVEDTHYIVTEYVAGETLRQRLTTASHKQLPLTEALTLTTQMAEALAAAHEAGIIHRDIKPENVMVRKDGYIKILDFGLAKLIEPNAPGVGIPIPPPTTSLTEAGVVMGTPRYMSPEQARGEKVDARTDIFSLGVMLYEMVAGQVPFAGATPSEMIAAILRDEPPPLTTDLPHELQRILRKALSKERRERYQTMTEMRADLNQCKQQSLSAEKNGVPTVGASSLTSPMAAARKLGRRRFVQATLVSLVLIVAATVYFSFFGGSGRAIDSLAVLPFVNVGANPDAEYLSDGVTDDLINKLAQLPKLKVMSRSAVFRYKGKETDAQQAGKALGVRAVLIGKVTPHGDDLDISVELVDVRDNSQLWGEKYKYKVSNLLPVQTDLARAVLQQLRLRLSGEDKQRLAKRGTDNPEAYELYMKGRFYRHASQFEKLEKAIEYLRQAIAKDARFALPYVELVDMYVGMATRGATYTIAHQEAVQKAKEAAAKAVELDDTLAEVHFALAQIARSFDWDWNTAEREYQRAIALSPNYAEAHHNYAHYLVAQGRFDEALTESLRALAADPLDIGINFHLGWHYFRTRQDEQAVAQLKKTVALDPNYSGAHAVLALAYGELGRYPEAFAEIQKNQDLKGRDLRGNWGRIYALAGQRDKAQKLLTQLLAETQLPGKHVSPYNIAVIYASLGEKEQAFAWLEKALAERDGNLPDPGLKTDRLFDNLHSDPRFTDLLRRMGFQP